MCLFVQNCCCCFSICGKIIMGFFFCLTIKNKTEIHVFLLCNHARKHCFIILNDRKYMWDHRFFWSVQLDLYFIFLSVYTNHFWRKLNINFKWYIPLFLSFMFRDPPSKKKAAKNKSKITLYGIFKNSIFSIPIYVWFLSEKPWMLITFCFNNMC